MIMGGDGDDIYDGFVYIPWVIVSLGFPASLCCVLSAIPRDLICHICHFIAWRVAVLNSHSQSPLHIYIASRNEASVMKQSHIVSRAR